MTQLEVQEIVDNIQRVIDRLEQIKSELDSTEYADTITGTTIAIDVDDGDVEDWCVELTNARDEIESISVHLERTL